MSYAPKTEVMNLRFPEGTFERIHDVLYGGEIRAAFVRLAVETELLRRENDQRSKDRTFHREMEELRQQLEKEKRDKSR